LLVSRFYPRKYLHRWSAVSRWPMITTAVLYDPIAHNVPSLNKIKLVERFRSFVFPKST
jgi:hypothetical protein